MNETYLFRLQEDLRLKNFTQNTYNDYYCFTKRFLEFAGKEAMSITYANIRKFIFHTKDHELKKASTINVYPADGSAGRTGWSFYRATSSTSRSCGQQQTGNW